MLPCISAAMLHMREHKNIFMLLTFLGIAYDAMTIVVRGESFTHKKEVPNYLA